MSKLSRLKSLELALDHAYWLNSDDSIRGLKVLVDALLDEAIERLREEIEDEENRDRT